MNQPAVSQLSLLESVRKLGPYFAPHRRLLAMVAALAIAGSALSALEPLVVRNVFDGFLSPHGVADGLRPLVLLGILLGICELMAAGLEWLQWRVRLSVDFALTQATVEHLHSLPLSFHKEQSVGATMTTVQRGIAGCMAAFSEVLSRLLPSVIWLAVSLVVTIRLEWRLSLAIIAIAPLPAILGAIASREQVVREQRLLELWTRIYARFNEVLSGIIVVKSYTMEDHEKRRFLDGVDGAKDVVLQGIGKDLRGVTARNALMAVARLVALGLGGVLVTRHEITMGTLVAFVGYLGGVFHPVQSLTGMYQTVRKASVSLHSLQNILDTKATFGDAPDARTLERVLGEVEFRDVSFEYRPGVPILKNVALHAQPGEMIALVGPSGAGKSTLMALLQRLYEPTSGSITIDGHDLRELTQRSLREQIAIVLQEGTLFSDSIRDNVAFGSPGATLDQVEAAARAANAHEFITALPDGYETPVGDRGTKLSGGERQRLAIARAVLKDAPILILDEATSALDAESEEKVQGALEKLMVGRTTFVIAHRLSTITRADRILVVKDGVIAESGKHEELMRLDGYYASLVRRQARGLIPDAA